MKPAPSIPGSEWQWSSVEDPCADRHRENSRLQLELELALRPVEPQGQVSPLNEGPQDRHKRETE